MQRKNQPKWYEKYLPFVARSPEMQLEWLVQTFRKGKLTEAEMTPYVRLLLASEEEEERMHLGELCRGLDEETALKMLQAADAYDTPKLFRLLAEPTLQHTLEALQKSPPPYEKNPELVLDKIFQAIHSRSETLLTQAVERLRESGQAPAHLEKAYERFQEILMDEKILSDLYPKAKLGED